MPVTFASRHWVCSFGVMFFRDGLKASLGFVTLTLCLELTHATMLGDDHGFEFESAEYRVAELGRVVELHVRRTGIGAAPGTVDYTTLDVTATTRQDYEPYSGTLYFYPFQTSASIVIQIRDDALAEGSETFQVILQNPTGGASRDEKAIAAVTIVDNETAGRPGRGVDGEVHALAAQPDGNVMVGGDFTTINGAGRTALARVHADLSVDDTFDAHLDSGTQIRRIAVQPDGRVIVLGTFTNIQGSARTRIARFERDGTLGRDFAPTFQPPSILRYYDPPVVSAVAPLPDGKILVSGLFTSVNGAVRVGIARLHPDGSVDLSFSHGNFIGGPPSSGGYGVDIALQPDGKIVLGGLGNTLRDTYHNTVLRLEPNGSVDTSFVSYLSSPYIWGGEVPVAVHSLATQRNGQILVLEIPNDLPYFGSGPPLVRLNQDGSEDIGFRQRAPWTVGFEFNGLYYGPNSQPISAAMEGPDGAIWLGGPALPPLMRLKSDGTYDLQTSNSFTVGTQAQAKLSEFTSNGSHVRTVAPVFPEVTAFALKPDGRIVIGGNFVSYGGVAAYGLAEMYPDGTPVGLLRLGSPKITQDGRLNLSLIVPSEQPFVLERSADLTQWESVFATTPTTNRLEVLDPDPIGDAARFYRLRSGNR